MTCAVVPSLSCCPCSSGHTVVCYADAALKPLQSSHAYALEVLSSFIRPVITRNHRTCVPKTTESSVMLLGALTTSVSTALRSKASTMASVDEKHRNPWRPAKAAKASAFGKEAKFDARTSFSTTKSPPRPWPKAGHPLHRVCHSAFVFTRSSGVALYLCEPVASRLQVPDSRCRLRHTLIGRSPCKYVGPKRSCMPTFQACPRWRHYLAATSPGM